ncbi:MAG TPA: IS110 family transposase [Chloroflexota bacterium]|nr:IS110 family transposase [Chloroflexota bacterium]
MTARQEKPLRTSERDAPAGSLAVQHPHAAGIDVHADVHFVAVAPGDVPAGFVNPEPRLPRGVRKFGATTGELEALAAWLKDCHVTTVAMEATGVYWIPLFELLERQGFAVLLVDPRQTKHAPGRPKSDVLDCQWIRRLHSYGLLTASFRPGDAVVVWRGYQRQREMLLRYAAQHVQHLQKALEQMNVKLTEVVADITGLTGLGIIRDIVRGERDPRQLARHRHPRCQASEAEIAAALHGTWRAEHLFALRQALALYDFYQGQLQECDAQIEACLRGFADRSGGRALPPRPRKRPGKKNRTTFDARALLFRLAGTDLTAVEGIDDATALVLLSEIGTDLSRFPTAKHFVSWLGLCPQHRGSNGRLLSRRVRKGANRAARALRLAAQGCHHAKNALGAFYRRLQARCGGPKAVVATARKIAERVYRLLRYGEAYERQAEAAYEAQYRRRTLQALARKAATLGYQLVPAEGG